MAQSPRQPRAHKRRRQTASKRTTPHPTSPSGIGGRNTRTELWIGHGSAGPEDIRTKDDRRAPQPVTGAALGPPRCVGDAPSAGRPRIIAQSPATPLRRVARAVVGILTEREGRGRIIRIALSRTRQEVGSWAASSSRTARPVDLGRWAVKSLRRKSPLRYAIISRRWCSMLYVAPLAPQSAMPSYVKPASTSQPAWCPSWNWPGSRSSAASARGVGSSVCGSIRQTSLAGARRPTRPNRECRQRRSPNPRGAAFAYTEPRASKDSSSASWAGCLRRPAGRPEASATTPRGEAAQPRRVRRWRRERTKPRSQRSHSGSTPGDASWPWRWC